MVYRDCEVYRWKTCEIHEAESTAGSIRGLLLDLLVL